MQQRVMLKVNEQAIKIYMLMNLIISLINGTKMIYIFLIYSCIFKLIFSLFATTEI